MLNFSSSQPYTHHRYASFPRVKREMWHRNQEVPTTLQTWVVDFGFRTTSDAVGQLLGMIYVTPEYGYWGEFLSLVERRWETYD